MSGPWEAAAVRRKTDGRRSENVSDEGGNFIGREGKQMSYAGVSHLFRTEFLLLGFQISFFFFASKRNRLREKITASSQKEKKNPSACVNENQSSVPGTLGCFFSV